MRLKSDGEINATAWSRFISSSDILVYETCGANQQVVSRKMTKQPKLTTHHVLFETDILGATVEDPYRWLEDIHSDEVRNE